MERQKRLWAVAFLLPAIVLYTVIGFLPNLGSIALSLFDWNGISPHMDFAGGQNFIDLIRDSVFYTALANNLVFTVASMSVSMIFGFVLAYFLYRGVAGGGFLRTIYYFPVVVSMVAAGMMWRWIYDPNFGLLNALLKGVGLGGLAGNWLGFGRALISVIAVSIWKTTGVAMILFIAGLQGMPKEVLESAQIDGANEPQSVRHIIVPMLTPVISIVVIILLIRSFSAFDLVYVMTGGGPGHASEVLSTYSYTEAFGALQVGYSSAIAVASFVLQFALAVVYLGRFRNENI